MVLGAALITQIAILELISSSLTAFNSSLVELKYAWDSLVIVEGGPADLKACLIRMSFEFVVYMAPGNMNIGIE